MISTPMTVPTSMPPAPVVPIVRLPIAPAPVATTSGSRLNLNTKLDDKGDLKVVGLGTRDLRPGFRYAIKSVSRDGVKTVNGKELPKE